MRRIRGAKMYLTRNKPCNSMQCEFLDLRNAVVCKKCKIEVINQLITINQTNGVSYKNLFHLFSR